MANSSDWTGGYVADIGYTYGYYPELNPLRVRHAFLDAGLASPRTMGAACELGFGQGVSLNVHAAASATEWWGTDFIPSQTAFAQELASASGAPARVYDEAFADFCHRADLPDFDYVGMHGTWSWVSEDNRAVIVDFLRRKLKVGGVVYVSYNTMPGWAPFAPVRDLLTEHVEAIGSTGGHGHGIVGRIDSALAFAEKLLAAEPRYMKANPQVAERLAAIKGKDRHYLAHEYFNRDWHPMPFARAAEKLRPAKLDYACSALLRDHAEVFNLSQRQQAFLAELPDAMFRESVRDFMTNQQFRRDYWVKGARRLARLERDELLRAERVVLVTPRADVALKTRGSTGDVTLLADIYEPLLDLLADHRARSVGEIEDALRGRGISFGKLCDAVLVLAALHHLHAAQDDSAIAAAKPRTDRLNGHLLSRARSDDGVSTLASPVTGGGFDVPRFSQLFLLALRQGEAQPAGWGRSAWQVLASQGQSVLKDGRALNGADANLAELTAQAEAFGRERLPVLRALGIA